MRVPTTPFSTTQALAIMQKLHKMPGHNYWPGFNNTFKGMGLRISVGKRYESSALFSVPGVDLSIEQKGDQERDNQ